MNPTLKPATSIILFALTALSVPTLLAADDGDAAASPDSVRVTSFRGHPPFKRRFESSRETADLARFEESDAEPTADSIRVADYRGRPPFKREVVSAEESADLARFEETSSSEDEDRETRRGPPGKPASRR